MAERIKAKLICLHMGNNALSEDMPLIPRQAYTMGRHPSARIPVMLSDVSHTHAVIRFSDNVWTIFDSGSRNGVYVNGKNIHSKQLEDGDEIQLGSALFRYTGELKNSWYFDILKKMKRPAFAAPLLSILILAVFFSNLYLRRPPHVINPKTSDKEGVSTNAYLKDTQDVFEPREGEAAPSVFPAFARKGLGFEALVHKISSEIQVYQNIANENVLLIDFPSLRRQGLMFNRMLAFTEGSGISRSRVLSDKELLDFLKKIKLTFETFAFGNDFALKDIVGFFNLAIQSKVKLNEEELRLQNILLDLRFMARDSRGRFLASSEEKAVISIVQRQQDDPKTAANELVDMDIRRTLLLHELSHGAFFTNKDYRAYCRNFWYFQMTSFERKAVKKMLSENNYDVSNETLCINEMQAYLLNTPDKRFFNAASLGMTEAELTAIQKRFLSGNPPTDLYDQNRRDLIQVLPKQKQPARDRCIFRLVAG